MKQPSESNPTSRPWLKTYHEARKQQTIDIVRATVDHLVREERTVTIEAICHLSVEVDPQGKGVRKAGILGNEAAYAYYREHSSSYRRAHQRNHRFEKEKQRTVSSVSIDPNRDISRVRSRYLSRTKADLVERLLTVEQAYAECQQQLARLQFALVDVQHEANKR
ncbi:hypothetical protein KDH_00210 [Dictyobacter sp. S3.2.2.5]|uniref:Transposase n=1 Tax=Dictyobacter halimunensis TaxID=3026934 RepID=A0ABQ6FJM0_9CHLR|nr:hypothetical protein KDH_00100 [Dictyobacter sp. S3.2.2.5]GLV53166.1 hypothetical protein KDH_00210 [Dictyobacter sp. S3.2.2.5]